MRFRVVHESSFKQIYKELLSKNEFTFAGSKEMTGEVEKFIHVFISYLDMSYNQLKKAQE
ncbi:hypothetical protein FLM06_15760 [Vibrio cholerae]|nr:hypothetical protein FLM06_15760 [Vibrio cholerae]